MIDNKILLQNVLRKLQGCFALLSNLFSRSPTFLYKAAFDYDPILSEGFIGEILPVISGENLHIVYLDIRNKKIQKHLTLDLRESSTNKRLQKLSVDHSMLHDCQVEGSYFLSIDSCEWVVFYDAESDFGVILSDNCEVMAVLSEYIVKQ